MKNKVYLVINDWSNESGGNVNMQNIKVFKDYSSAKEEFNKIKENIKSFELNYNGLEDEENSYCEFEEGEYLYCHELVYIVEKEVF